MNSAPLVPMIDLLAAVPGNRGGGAASGSAAHRRAADSRSQLLWLAFGGGADQGWMRMLRPGFRHCFAGLRDEAGWTVLDPLSGRLLVTRLAVDSGFDLPGFWRRAGCRVLGPFVPGAPARALPAVVPLSCVSLCRALLGPAAPFAVTPYGLFRRLEKNFRIKENVLYNCDGRG
ncbi:hypothetical protein [Roseomonas sp. KE2513]|uniref:hypothetical protein n=1 Tax=Roseomonas sp. KE2513 TaxID=2479202 RepID=UPI0018DF01FC|nr:hypothetical protein [Roseomonas sp. KE2513]